MDKEKFTEQLRFFLKSRNVKQKELAEMVGVSAVTISNLLNGRDNFGAKAAAAWATALGIDPMWLLTQGEQGTAPNGGTTAPITAITTHDDIIKVPVINLDVRGGLLPNATTIKFLTAEEVEMLKAAKVGEVLDRVRDLWLFSFYTGFSYAELASFDAAKIVKNGRRHYYEAHRLKTGAPVKVLIVSEARALLAKYNGVLPVISNQRYNGYLKLLATAAGIDKNLTSHMARHSFATFALSKGVPRDVIAVMLGHTGTREVDRYAKRLQEDVDKQYMKLERAFKTE